MAATEPIKIAILAMGGEGGGVLADWIVDLAENNGYMAQSTSVPGVAQRTGATIYYVELYPRAQAERDGASPVLALMPLPGDVDVVLASELMEAGRAVQRGLVTPDRTVLVASTHRVYAIAEKIALGDGRVDAENLIAHARIAARQFVGFDMERSAEEAGSVISAVLFGALAGTGVLPFAREQFEATVARGEVGVQPSLRAFAAALERAATQLEAQASGAPESPELRGTPPAPVQPVSGVPADPQVRALLHRIATQFPAAATPVLIEGVRRLIDYQDPDYARLYLDRLERIATLSALGEEPLLQECARHLALWMSYEDTVRVAELKTRAIRFQRVREEVRAGSDQLLRISEFMHPRLEEICDTLPASLGRWLLASGRPRRLAERFTGKGRVITTSSLPGFLLLYLLSRMKRWRRGSLRFAVETGRIEQWLACVERTAVLDPALALEVARCQRLVKGYGDTFARGWTSFETLMRVVQGRGDAVTPAILRELRDAALADERGELLRTTLARHALA